MNERPDDKIKDLRGCVLALLQIGLVCAGGLLTVGSAAYLLRHLLDGLLK